MSERDPLLKRGANAPQIPSRSNSLGLSTDVVTPEPINPVATPSTLNKISRKDLIWVLFGLWSAVFLGALDGVFYI